MHRTRRSLRVLVHRSPGDLFTAAALAALIAATITAIVRSQLPGDQVIKWTGFSLITGVIFWRSIADRSASLKKRPLWLVSAMLLLAHAVTWSIVFLHVEAWKLVWFGPLISLEIIAIFYCVDRLSGKPRKTQVPTT